MKIRDEWSNRQKNKQTARLMTGQKDRWTDGCKDRLIDEQTERQMDRSM